MNRLLRVFGTRLPVCDRHPASKAAQFTDEHARVNTLFGEAESAGDPSNRTPQRAAEIQPNL
jgi:hypothetical protein